MRNLRSSGRQRVLDTAAVLQMHRSELAADLSDRGASSGAETLAAGFDLNRRLHQVAAEWRDLLSVRSIATSHQLRLCLPVNRRFLETTSVQMVSVFNHDALDLDARLLLANEPIGNYLFGFAPVQMKIVDRRFVILQGPDVDGEPSIMKVTAPTCLEAAFRYWDAVLATSVPAREGERRLGPLTARQHQIVALMVNDLGDDAIGAALGVSVRTVRTDIAAVLETLGVRSRFAAAARLQLWANQSAATMEPER
jgi:DNA-binding CsgD family transcriptional regulator